MYLIIDLLAIAATLSFIFLAPLMYWLVFGRNNSPTAKERRATDKHKRRVARAKLKLTKAKQKGV